jgi:hypothetical protein
MQISKYLLAAAIFSAGLSPVFSQTDAEQAEDRAQAREELNRKMAELEAQLQEADQPKPLVEGTPSKLEEKTTTTEDPPVVPKPIETPVVENKKPVVESPAEPKPIAAAPVIIPKPTPVPTIANPPGISREAIERARAEMRRKIAELDAQDRKPPPQFLLFPPRPRKLKAMLQPQTKPALSAPAKKCAAKSPT